MAFAKRMHKASLDPEKIRMLPDQFTVSMLAKACGVQRDAVVRWVFQCNLPSHDVKKVKSFLMVIKKDEFVQWAIEQGRLVMP